MAEALNSIRVTSRRTGLSAHVIRIWEKRYGAVAPERTCTNRRLYSEEEVERLSLLRRATESGHSIGQVAKLSNERLKALMDSVPGGATGGGGEEARGPVMPERVVFEECLSAVKALDAPGFARALDRGAVELGGVGLLQRVVAPLSQELGRLWREGVITAAHEHFASEALRTYLGQSSNHFSGPEGAPVLLVATPAGQIHELGALLASASAAYLGWRVTYLGPSLPAAEIAGAARQNGARAVALSVVYPEDDPHLAGELSRLRELLPERVTILVGGRATAGYQEVIQRIGAVELRDLPHLCATLDELRRPVRKASR